MKYLGVEIGGTKLQLAVGNGDQIEELVRRDVDPAKEADGIREQLNQLIPEVCARHTISAVGIGFGGPVDTASGMTTTSHQVKGWDSFPLAEWVEKISGRSCSIVNDCDAAALAESQIGAGSEFSRVIYVTVGTGVGGGCVIDGVLQGAGRPAAMEIGHLRPGLECIRHSETVESLASGRGIEQQLARRIEEHADDPELLELKISSMSDGRDLTAREICQLAGEGNGAALGVIDQACRALGWAIAQCITLLAADCVVIGGGVSLAGEKLFFEPVRRCVSVYVFPGLADTYEILPASLGEEVVLYGALQIARQNSPAANES